MKHLVGFAIESIELGLFNEIIKISLSMSYIKKANNIICSIITKTYQLRLEPHLSIQLASTKKNKMTF